MSMTSENPYNSPACVGEQSQFMEQGIIEEISEADR
jgi:hypothetical protein